MKIYIYPNHRQYPTYTHLHTQRQNSQTQDPPFPKKASNKVITPPPNLLPITTLEHGVNVTPLPFPPSAMTSFSFHTVIQLFSIRRRQKGVARRTSQSVVVRYISVAPPKLVWIVSIFQIGLVWLSSRTTSSIVSIIRRALLLAFYNGIQREKRSEQARYTDTEDKTINRLIFLKYFPRKT